MSKVRRPHPNPPPQAREGSRETKSDPRKVRLAAIKIELDTQLTRVAELRKAYTHEDDKLFDLLREQQLLKEDIKATKRQGAPTLTLPRTRGRGREAKQ